jgi:hypothetical protein
MHGWQQLNPPVSLKALPKAFFTLFAVLLILGIQLLSAGVKGR